jgi:DNA-binding PadR family transcriptional regulator
MARLIYSAIMSLDGCTADADGRFEWAAPDEEVFAFVNELERPVGTYLAAGPQHGYAIITDAGRTSGGVTRLQTGTLYMALDRLCSAGLVEPDREEVADGRLRRYYRLTDEGAALLAAETERRRATAAVAAQRLSARLAGGTA